MTPELLRRFEKLERQKRATLAAVAGLSEAQFHFRPQPTSWSALEVLDHLVKVEQAILADIRAQLPNGAPLKLGDRMRAWMLIGLVQLPVRLKVPAEAPMILPALTTDLPGTTTRWTEVRQEVADMLHSLQPDQLRRGLFRHPASGWMTIAQTLAFFSAHLRHHDYQLNRLKSAARSL